MKKKICVYASSSNKIPEEYFLVAKKLGELIAENGYDMVFGAGGIGTMLETASSAKNRGAKVYGIIPQKLKDLKLEWSGCDELVVTECMASRKKEMRVLADAFIAIPGGFGTLEEVLEVITLKQLGYHAKPIVFLNTNNFYENLLKQFSKMYEQNFAKKVSEKLYFVANTPNEAIEYIRTYTETEPVSKWDK